MRSARYLLLTLGVAWGSGGPTQAQEALVAMVAGYPITAAELAFQEARFSATGTVIPAGPHRRQLLELLISRELLRAEGRARGLEQNPEIAEDLARLEQTLLLQEIEGQEGLLQPGPVSEAEVEALYLEWGSGEEVRASQILVEGEDLARQLIAQLQQGAAFAELAKGHSIHKLSGLGGGDMGYLRQEMLLSEFREQVWKLGAGELYPAPLASRLGYHVVRVEERRQRTLEELRTALVAELERRHQEEARSEVGRRLREQYRFRWNAAAAQSLIGRERPTATAADSATVVAHWEGGELNAAAYLKGLRIYGVRQSLADSSLARQRGEQLVVEDLLLAEARRRQYGRNPALRRRLAAREAELLAERLFVQEAMQKAAVGDSALQVYYERHPDQYRIPPGVEVREILVADRGTADSLRALILAGADMGRLAREHSSRTWAREKEGILGVLSRDSAGYGPLLPLALEAPVGVLQGPVPLGNEWALFMVVRRIPDRLATFAEARDVVRKQMLGQEMDRFIAVLRQKYADQIQVDEQALEALSSSGR